MHLLVAVIESPENVESILDRFYENNITGATVLDGKGMGHVIAHRHSIFARFADLAGTVEESMHNNVIFTVIREEEILDRAIDIIEEEVGDLSEPNTGLLFTVGLDRVRGLAPPIDEE